MVREFLLRLWKHLNDMNQAEKHLHDGVVAKEYDVAGAA